MTVPRHYSLSLDLDRAAQTFSGRVVIDVEPDGAPIVLDCVGLEIDSATPAIIERSDATITLAGGASRVEIAFRGRMSTHSDGLYGGEGFCITQMQPSNARRVFPCFDAPHLKATWDISVTSGNDVVIANGGTGALMPPHLVLVAAGEFHTSNFTFGDIPVRLFTIDDPSRHTAFVDAARNALAAHAAYLATPYPWPRLDIVIVPSFEADGMEYTGAVVFRAGSAAVRIETVVAHELAHQWFGSLVTPRSWNDLWLSEGIATWLAAQATGDDVFVVREIRSAMSVDSSLSARPLLSAAADAKEIFDPITYAKGAAILRMLEQHLGTEAVREGVREYLRRHTGGTATTADLWDALPEGAPLARPCIEHTGVPQLSFDWNGDTVRVTRRDPNARAVPMSMRIRLADGSTIERRDIVANDNFSFTAPAEVKSVFGNTNAAGYYRCSYRRWSAVALDGLTPAEKVTFLLDLADAMWAAETDTLVLLRVLETMSNDSSTANLRRELGDQLRELLTPAAPTANESDVAILLQTQGAERIAKCEELLCDAKTRRATWSFMKEHWDVLQHDLISFGGRGAIPALAAASEPDLRNDIAAFFAQHPPRGAERALQHTLQQIDGRIRFREREQRKYVCRTVWLEAGRPAATPQMRAAHSLLNGLTGAVSGALLTRSLFDQLRMAAPEWMQPARELAATLTTLEQRFLQVFAGHAPVDESLLQVAAAARDELNAAGAMAENTSPAILAILAAREAASREHILGGVIAFADLFDGEDAASRWRAALLQADRSVVLARVNVMRILRGDADDALRGALTNAALMLPGTLRSQAVDLTAIEAGFRGDRSFDHAAATWAAFGFSAEEAERLRGAGFAHPAQARLAAARS